MSKVENAQVHEGKYLTGEFTMPEYPPCGCGAFGDQTCPDWDIPTNTLLKTGFCLKCKQRRSDGVYVTKSGMMRID